MLTLRLAWRAFWRHKRRSLIAAVAVALGLALTLFMLGTADDAHRRMAEMGIRLGSGHVLVQGEGYQEQQTLDHLVEQPERVIEAARKIPHVDQVVQRINANGLLSSGEASAPVMFSGVDPELEPQVSDIASEKKRVAGGYLRARAQMPFSNQPADIYLGKQLAKTLHAELGDRLVLTATPRGGGRPTSAAFFVRGIFRSGITDIDSFIVQIPIGEARQLLRIGPRATQVSLLLDDLDQTQRVTAALNAALAGEDGIEVLPWQRALKELYDALVIDDGGAYVTLAIIFFLVCIGIFNTLLMSVVERTREFGVMMALGTSQRRMFGVVVAESGVLALIGTLLGLGLGLALHLWVASSGIDLVGDNPYEIAGVVFEGKIYSRLSAAVCLRWSLLVFGIVVICGLYPAWRATRLQPVEAMRHA
jgi:ABC-type lipoprotein release transport system permease subunit